MADSAERRVYFSISKSENSHADNTYEDTFCTNELDSSRRHSDWQQQQTLCVVSSGNVSEWLRTKHHSQSMRSAFHSLCRWIVPLQIRCHQWRGCWLLLPRMNQWMTDYCASAYRTLSFLLRRNELVLSHPLKACSAGNAGETSGTNSFAYTCTYSTCHLQLSTSVSINNLWCILKE